ESQHRNGNTIIVGDYYHIQSTVTYDYYGTDGIYLGQQSITGLYNKPYSVNVPNKFGNYYIEGSTTQSGTYPKHDEILDVYYKYVPPIVYYNTSNPYATTYYANGYEYVPNYIAPVIYYALTYGYYDGGTSYSGGYGYSSGGEDGSTSVASSGGYSLYVPQSAYYSKEAQLVAEENGTYKTSERKTSSVENVDDGYEYIQNGKLYVNWGTVNSKILGGISVSIASVGVASAGMNFNDDDGSPLSPESGEEPEWDGLGDSIGEFGEYEEEREEDDLYEGGGANDPQ
ncbi:MAG: cell wall anchor protein, partial [Lactococcus lactis]|nr:cell wall anchor protein [Lactococcus lactis]